MSVSYDIPDGVTVQASPYGTVDVLVDGVKDTRSFRLRDRERREIGDKDLTGATVYVRVQPWQVEKSTVRSYDPSSGLVTLATDLTLPSESVRTLSIARWKKETPPDLGRRPTVFLFLA